MEECGTGNQVMVDGGRLLAAEEKDSGKFSLHSLNTRLPRLFVPSVVELTCAVCVCVFCNSFAHL